MADRIVGNPPTITVSGDVITWAANEFDFAIFSEAGHDYVYNVTLGTTSLIVSNDGLNGTSYEITITSGHGFSTGNRCTPQVGNTTNNYSTIAAAWTAASTDGSDTLRLYFVDTNETTDWLESINGGSATTDCVSIIGMLPDQRVTMGAKNGQFTLSYNGDLSSVVNEITISNLSVHGGSFGAVRIRDTTASANFGGCIIERLVVLGTPVIGLRYAGKNAGAIIRNNIVIGCGAQGIETLAGTAKILGNTVIGCGTGIDNVSRANTIIDNICVANGTDYDRKTNGTYTTNWSSDGTGNTTGKYAKDIGFVGLDGANGQYPQDYRVTTSASVLAQGTGHADLINDIGGQTRVNNDIGASIGISYATPADFPDVGNVVVGDTTNGIPGTYVPLPEEFGKLNKQWGEDNIEFTGALQEASVPVGRPSTGTKRNTLRQIRQIVYSLTRTYGVHVDIYQPDDAITNDRRTGEITKTFSITRLSHVMVLTGEMIRTFTYDLSYIASNKNFTYGGLFERNTRIFIFNRADMAKSFRFDLNDHLVYDSRRYEIKSIDKTAGEYGYLVLANDIAEVPDQVQHLVKVFQTLGVDQNASGI